MARNWKKMSKEEEDKKRQETIDKAMEEYYHNISKGDIEL